MKRKKRLTLTETLRKAIEESGLTLYQIAADTGVQRASLIRFCRGEQSLRLDMADKLAEHFALELTKGKDS